MLAARWADDIRMQAKLQREVKMALHQLSLQAGRRARRHKTTGPTSRQYSFGTGGEPANRPKARYRRIKRAIALAWLFHPRWRCSSALTYGAAVHPEKYPTVTVAAMKCAFGCHQSARPLDLQ